MALPNLSEKESKRLREIQFEYNFRKLEKLESDQVTIINGNVFLTPVNDGNQNRLIGSMAKEKSEDLKKEYPDFLRLAVAHYLDGTGGTCCICHHKYGDIDDAIDDAISKDIHLVSRVGIDRIACKECYERKN